MAPPFPGAFFDAGPHRVELLGSYIRGETARHEIPAIYVEDGRFQADCSDGQRFQVTKLCIDGKQVGPEGFQAIFGTRLLLDGVAGE